jgi:hypothetical protein
MTTFDAAAWLREFRAVGGDVTVRAGSMWIETADVTLPLDRFTSMIVGHPERREAIKALVLERQREPADAR